MSLRSLTLLALAAALAAPALAYTVYLKDGSTIDAEGPYTVRGEEAIIVLRNGTTTSLPASEIDVEKTQRNNRGALADALLLKDGEVVDLDTARQAPRRETLQDKIARGEVVTTSRPRLPASAPAAAVSAAPAVAGGERRPLPDAALAEAIRAVFQEESVGELGVYEGGSGTRPLVEVTTNAESSVFRGILVAALALQRVRGRGGAVEAFDLRFSTPNHQSGGDFLLTPELAEELTSGRLEPSEFYVEHVRF